MKAMQLFLFVFIRLPALPFSKDSFISLLQTLCNEDIKGDIK